MESNLKFSRRHLLQIVPAGLLGMPSLLRAVDTSQKRKRCKSIIYLHQYGGPSQFETFDMKPSAPAEVRGTFKPIQSKLPGVPVCELLPRTATVMDKVTVIRSVQHTMKNHNSAGYYSLTGFAPPTDDQRLRDSLELMPAFGSIVDKFAPAAKGVPSFVSYPHVIRDGSITPGQHASFLGKLHNPFFINQDPNSLDFKLPELSLPATLTPERLENRKDVLKLIDAQTDLIEKSAVAHGIDESYQKAVAMLSSKEFKKAFDLSAEKKEVRDKYGRTTYGQGCLLARRLVEAGVKFVTVYLSASIGGCEGGWDTHGFNDKPMDPILKNYLLPLTDKTLPTLLDDLDERGMLDETLVLWMGEFGRTPRINKLAGRDHWPQCYSALLAGGGIKRGYVHGASDRIGAYPDQGLVRIEDISATFYELLGIDPEIEIKDKLNKPSPISKGMAIREVLA
jgi:hypothetical protein